MKSLNELNLVINTEDGYIIANKPSGLNTHSSDIHLKGFVEWLEEKLETKLYTFQRLDKGTSGVILFALSSQSANFLTQQFKEQKVHKKYLFLTDKQISTQKISIEGDIIKKGNQFILDDSKNNLQEQTKCCTHFTLIQSYKNFSLWEAHPETGKPHQIRIHAQKANISILGDIQHGGSPFIRLCLHCISTEISVLNIKGEAQPPAYFSNLELLENLFYCTLETAWHQRSSSYNLNYNNQNCWRLLHSEIENIKIDIFNHTAWVYDYTSDPNSKQSLNKKYKFDLSDKIVHSTLLRFLKDKKIENYFIREMKNRGQLPLHAELLQSSNSQQVWTTIENGLNFEIRSNQGLSPGLFLDQRENRKFILKNAKDKSVLNLFSYTGGFSVAAAAGGAASVTTVDLSSNFIEWSKKNFQLNNFDVNNIHTKYKFWSADARVFIEGSKKRNQIYNIIVCDPPSFARVKNNIFKLESDLSELFYSLFEILSENGILLFSCNFEKWNFAQFTEKCLQLIIKNKKKFQIINTPLLSLDYELPDQASLLKTFIIKKLG